MSTAIKVENLSKAYQLGTFSTGTLSLDIERWWAKIRGKQDPFLRIGEVNDRSKKGDNNVVWSLKNIDFEIKQGEAVGIIGKNGAGKSTLLKILSRVTSPTNGIVKAKGRIASLLEVGTGFHPELTGRENIYLNGAILGMRKHEITRKLDEIVDFSGVERYLDTPVKRYSSGMYVRLAFAVAAHLESEILIVDEVLAVGDAEFQNKCLGKMGDISKSGGRTVLFVSHNLSMIKTLCENSLWLEKGQINGFDQTQEIINQYLLHNVHNIELKSSYNNESLAPVFVSSAKLLNTDIESSFFSADEDIIIDITFQKKSLIRGVYSHLMIYNSEEELYIETDTIEGTKNQLDSDYVGEINSVVKIPKRVLKTGKYFVSIGIASEHYTGFMIESLRAFLGFEIVANKTARDSNRKAKTSVILSWDFNFIDE